VNLPTFQPEQIIGALARNQVEYILIGGLAAVAWQSPYSTRDVDICPDRRGPNLSRLANALIELAAKRVTDLEPEGVDVVITADYLSKENELAFMTSAGPLDIVFVPRGTQGYDDLRREASTEAVFEERVRISSIDDVIRMKDARGMPKDRLVVDLLREIQERRRKGPERSD
jgi:hypothetical protein